MMSKGIYAWLPLGLKVMRKIEEIIHQEMQNIGFQSLLIPTLQPSSLWKKSGRYESYGPEMLRVQDRHEQEFVYGPTAEECATEIFSRGNLSYHQLPQRLYNIQWKFRDEMRPRFGVLRGREFLMKDGYTFDIDHDSAIQTYKDVFAAYMKIFTRMDLHPIPASADTGVMGGSMSHDFHVRTEIGEDTLVYDQQWENIKHPTWKDVETYYASSQDNQPHQQEVLCSNKSIEIGHIFLLGTKYTDSMDVKMQDHNGEKFSPIMGCYGIGVSRLMSVLIEKHHDEFGIKWPVAVAPYQILLVNLRTDNDECVTYCNKIYHTLTENKNLSNEVLYDDREGISMGEKFNTADLIGIPYQILVGPKDMEQGVVTIKNRHTGEKKVVSRDSIIDYFKSQNLGNADLEKIFL